MMKAMERQTQRRIETDKDGLRKGKQRKREMGVCFAFHKHPWGDASMLRWQ